MRDGEQSKCNNSMINGAWDSTDAPTRGSALSFTYARSGALMARVGAHGQSNQQTNEDPNTPINEYFSAFDNAAPAPPPSSPRRTPPLGPATRTRW